MILQILYCNNYINNKLGWTLLAEHGNNVNKEFIIFQGNILMRLQNNCLNWTFEIHSRVLNEAMKTCPPVEVSLEIFYFSILYSRVRQWKTVVRISRMSLEKLGFIGSTWRGDCPSDCHLLTSYGSGLLG